MTQVIAKFDVFVRLVVESEDGDYISGNDWTMDHDWANYKDHFNDSGAMDFDIEDNEPQSGLIDSTDDEAEDITISHRDLLTMINDLQHRVKSLEIK